MKWQRFFVYEEEDNSSIIGITRNIARNLHLLFFLLFWVAGFATFTGEDPYIYLFMNFVFIPPLVFFWTPVFQNKFFDKETSFGKKLLVYLFLYTIVGVFFLYWMFYRSWRGEKLNLQTDSTAEQTPKNPSSQRKSDFKHRDRVKEILDEDEEIEFVFTANQFRFGNTNRSVGKNYTIFTNKRVLLYTARAIRKDSVDMLPYEEIIDIDFKKGIMLNRRVTLKSLGGEIIIKTQDINSDSFKELERIYNINSATPEQPEDSNYLSVLTPLINKNLAKAEDVRTVEVKQGSFIHQIILNRDTGAGHLVLLDDVDSAQAQRIAKNHLYVEEIDTEESVPALQGTQTSSKSVTVGVNSVKQGLAIIGAVLENQQGKTDLTEIEIRFRDSSGWSESFQLQEELEANADDFQLLDRVWRSEAPESLEDKKKEVLREVVQAVFSNKDTDEAEESLQEYEEEREELLSNFYHNYQEEIDSFLEEHGAGNKEQVRKLEKLLEKRQGEQVSLQDLELVINEKWRERQKKSLKERLEEYEPENTDEYVEAFVKEMGGGNQKSRQLLSEILDERFTVVEDLVNSKLEELREQKEQEKFEEELGLKDDNEGKEVEDTDALEDLKQAEYEWSEVENMEGIEFEYFLEELFTEAGYNARVTTASNDQGADLVLEKPYETVVVQAKRYQGKVSNSAVQEITGARNHYDADRAIVVTTKGFTSSAKELAESNDVELWGKKELTEKIDKYLNKSKI